MSDDLAIRKRLNDERRELPVCSGDEDANRSLAGRLSPVLEALLQPGGLLLGDRAFDMPSCRDISAETNVPEGRYFVYRKEA